VLGATITKQLFAGNPSPLGERIYLNNYPYEVVGLMDEKDQNSPTTAGITTRSSSPKRFCSKTCPPAAKSTLKATLGHSLQTRLRRPVGGGSGPGRAAVGRVHGFDKDDKGALEMFDSVESAQMFDSIFTAGEIFLAVVALITLSLGGIGVMNTMMMAVAERTHEIGLKKALGATSRRILVDFFLEGLFLALLSGAAGLILVLGLTTIVNSLPMPVMFSGLPVHWKMLAFATLALGIVAVGSALPPARRAAAMTPVEALRYER